MTKHIAFIMDGNRRYSEKNKFGKNIGYKAGLDKFLEMVSYQIKYGIEETSFFALSSDNFKKRSEDELNVLKKLLETFHMDENVKEFFLRNKIKINVKGNDSVNKGKLKSFGITNLKKKVENWNDENESHDFQVNLAVNYDGQEEIVHSIKEIFKQIKEGKIKESKISTKLIKENLWFTGNEPDVIVRPGNVPRISGFMLWDSAYSEIYLTKKLWPELDESDFITILDWFKSIKRNFGE